MSKRKQSRRIVDMLTIDHSEWAIDKHLAHHKPTDIVFWIGNGINYFETDHRSAAQFELSFFQKIRLYNWLKKDGGLISLEKKLDSIRMAELKKLLKDSPG